MYGKPDEADLRKVGRMLDSTVDRYLLKDWELELGQMCLDARPELFEEMVRLKEG